MQRSILDPSLNWPNVLYIVVAAILGWLAKSAYKWVLLWMQRKAPQATITETLARAHKTEAEARQIDLQANLTAATSVMAMVERMLEAQATIDTLRAENGQQGAELMLMEVQVRRLKALLDLHGIKYSEVDERRQLEG